MIQTSDVCSGFGLHHIHLLQVQTHRKKATHKRHKEQIIQIIQSPLL